MMIAKIVTALRWPLLAAIVKFLLVRHAESYGIRNRERLSATYRRRLLENRDKVRVSQARCQPEKQFADLSKPTQARALKRKAMLDAYYTVAFETKLPPSYAELAARAIGLLLFSKAPCPRTIRRYVRRIERCGGPEFAPLEVYADEKSCPHPKARKTFLKEAA